MKFKITENIGNSILVVIYRATKSTGLTNIETSGYY